MFLWAFFMRLHVVKFTKLSNRSRKTDKLCVHKSCLCSECYKFCPPKTSSINKPPFGASHSFPFVYIIMIPLWSILLTIRTLLRLFIFMSHTICNRHRRFHIWTFYQFVFLELAPTLLPTCKHSVIKRSLLQMDIRCSFPLYYRTSVYVKVERSMIN